MTQGTNGRLVIMVAGPYSAPTAAERARNLRTLNEAAAEILRRGHIPVIGVNAALPVLEAAERQHADAAMMAISLALAERCDGVLRIGRSVGADREVALLRNLGRPVYETVADLPKLEPIAGWS